MSDVPINNVGSGNVAGLGIGPQGEPGIKKKPTILRRKPRKLTENDLFMGSRIFDIDPKRYFQSRFGKRKYARWMNYVGDDEVGNKIRMYGKLFPNKPIILRNINTGEMLFLRYIN